MCGCSCCFFLSSTFVNVIFFFIVFAPKCIHTENNYAQEAGKTSLALHRMYWIFQRMMTVAVVRIKWVCVGLGGSMEFVCIYTIIMKLEERKTKSKVFTGKCTAKWFHFRLFSTELKEIEMDAYIYTWTYTYEMHTYKKWVWKGVGVSEP